MAVIRIRGGRSLDGAVRIDGSKNAVLPILAATLLGTGETVISDVPWLDDVDTICRVLASLGATVHADPAGEVRVEVSRPLRSEAPYDLVRRMRASFLVLGPLLARLGRARIPLPGGCAIGSRPIDLHLKGFEAMGASTEVGAGYIEVRANRLRGSEIYLDFPSVGATENLIMAAVLAEGTTVIENAAEEPEVVDLANFLTTMGAEIRGAGTREIRVSGQSSLRAASYEVIPDRIEAGTFLTAVAMTGGEVTLENVLPEHLTSVLAKLRETGLNIAEEPGKIHLVAERRPLAVDVKTLPYPGFPTDVQAPLTALLALAEGSGVVTETVFENRFMHIDELKRMGARIKVEGRTAFIQGVPRLSGAPVRATDLRAGAALVLAGLAADGVTLVSEVGHLDRGYRHLEAKFRALGADIRRISD